MNKTIWYGIQDNNVAFAQNESSLNNAQNVQSFTVNGDVSGLNLIDEQSNDTVQTQSASA